MAIDPRRIGQQAEGLALQGMALQQQAALAINAQAIEILKIEHDFPDKENLQTLCSQYLVRCFASPATPVAQV